MDEKLKQFIEGQLIVATLLYSIKMLSVPKEANGDVAEKAVKDWASESSTRFIEHLDKQGYVIVPKEPALEVFRPNGTSN